MGATAKGIGDRVRRLREESGLSQTDLAHPTYSGAYISHIEHGKRAPSPAALAHIAAKLGVDRKYLATGVDPNEDIRLQVAVQTARMKAYGGDIEAGKRLLKSTIRRAKKLGFRKHAAKAEQALGLILLRENEFQQALEHFDSAEHAVTGEPADERTPAVTGRARTHFAMGDVRFAIHILESHLLTLNQSSSPDPSALMQTYSALIGPYFESGLIEKAQSAADEAARLEARVGDEEHLACMHINRAGVLLHNHRRQEALRSLDRAEELFLRLDWRTEAANQRSHGVRLFWRRANSSLQEMH